MVTKSFAQLNGKMLFLIYSNLFSILWSIVDGQNCTCGKEILTTRIVGGKESLPNTNLWAAALVSSSKNEIFCGGSLINNRYILTASHCLSPFVEDEIKVALGFRSLSSIEHLETVYNVESIIMHPDYNPNDPFQLNDIALLRLETEVEFTRRIQPVCLPDDSIEIDYTIRPLLVVGWGKVSEEGDYSDKLREANIPYVDNERCTESYNENLITDNHICAGELAKDSCYGDSGGGLIYFHKPNKVYQLGIVSWGVACGSDKPGVYTRVASYMNWIDEETRDANKCF